jgi:hypothetical protein
MTRTSIHAVCVLAALSLIACPATEPDPGADAGVQIQEDTGGGGGEDTGGGGGGGEDTGGGGGGDCVDVDVFTDGDGDGKGDDASKATVCLAAGEQPAQGQVRVGGDCNDADPLQFSGSEGVCNDFVDDDCDGDDEVCPESRPDQVTVPDWDCTGDPPESVYAWARFEDGGDLLEDGACFVYFEGGKDVFYSTRSGVAPANGCAGRDCVCPGGYDQRLYAFNISGAPDACDDIVHSNSQGMDQAVSNDCRKYLYQLYEFDNAYSHVATTTAALDLRLASFPTVEVACVGDSTFGFPFSSLLTAEVELNPDFVKK